jgi:hypothetical protein
MHHGWDIYGRIWKLFFLFLLPQTVGNFAPSEEEETNVVMLYIYHDMENCSRMSASLQIYSCKFTCSLFLVKSLFVCPDSSARVMVVVGVCMDSVNGSVGLGWLEVLKGLLLNLFCRQSLGASTTPGNPSFLLKEADFQKDTTGFCTKFNEGAR